MKRSINTPDSLIQHLRLKPHPEGGYYREVYRSNQTISGTSNRFPSHRSYFTSIYFLLRKQDVSKFHKIKSDEIWYLHMGGPLTIVELQPKGGVKKTILGQRIDHGEVLQYCVPKNTWFGAHPGSHIEYSLVSCTVSPGFDFQDFKMGRRDQLVKKYPSAKSVILKLT